MGPDTNIFPSLHNYQPGIISDSKKPKDTFIGAYTLEKYQGLSRKKINGILSIPKVSAWKYDTEEASVCVVWAPRVVTRSEPMDKFGECSEPAGELHMGVLLVKRRNDLLGF